MEKQDQVTTIREQWRKEQPDIDTFPMEVIGRISRLSLLFDRQLEQGFKKFGLSSWGFDVLATLRRAGKPYRLSPTDLFNAMMVTSGTMTNRIDHLEHAGLVVRLPDPTDRRGLLIELTLKGQELVEKALLEHVQNEELLLHVLSHSEREDLAHLLQNLLHSLEQK